MKFLLTTGFLAFALFVNAQVSEMVQNMSQGSKPCMSIDLKGTDTKTVEAAWTKYMKDFKGKSKKDKSSGEILSDDSMIKNMSSNSVDVYSKSVQEGTDVKMNVWIDLGGAYVSKESHSDAYAVAQNMLIDFSKTVSTAAVEEQIKEEEGVLKKMEDDLKKLGKDKTNLEDEIAKSEQKIEKAKADIEANKVAQEEQQKMINAQMEKLNGVKGQLKKI